MKLLILKLEGPLMKWGLRAKWEERDTHIVPTKSGVVGLLSAALGYHRFDPRIQELSNSLSFGVRADRGAMPLVDFHIVSTASNPYIFNLCDAAYKKRKGEGGLLTYRHYLQDASFTAVISSEDEDLLERLAYALQNPVFPVYLGTKSCPPSRPVFEVLTEEYASVIDALNNYPLSERAIKGRIYCEIDDPGGASIRQDEIRINNLRDYGFRRVKVFYTGG